YFRPYTVRHAKGVKQTPKTRGRLPGGAPRRRHRHRAQRSGRGAGDRDHSRDARRRCRVWANRWTDRRSEAGAGTQRQEAIGDREEGGGGPLERKDLTGCPFVLIL